MEPDFVFLLYPIKDLRTDPKYTYVAPGHEFQDIYVEWRVFFWDDDPVWTSTLRRRNQLYYG